ncbi:hypothetical protein, partial [Pseudomonas aeruginosa]|uniref:hypothetical protein n=3 Tax=Pseudomonas aeruginosa TaxID=287 RepID=UPI0021194379
NPGGAVMTNTDLKPLLDNLRNATEFWNLVKEASATDEDTVHNRSYRDALDWLESAALALGDALIAQRKAVGGDHE